MRCALPVCAAWVPSEMLSLDAPAMQPSLDPRNHGTACSQVMAATARLHRRAAVGMLTPQELGFADDEEAHAFTGQV